MKMTVQVPVTTKSFEPMEVEFPIYRKVETKLYFARVDFVGSGMRECSVQTKKNGQVQFRANNEYKFGGEELDFLLGRGDFESSEAEFLAALQSVSNLVAKISGSIEV